MTRPREYLRPVAGSWNGENRLRIMPDDPWQTSVATALVQVHARGHLATLAYTWEESGNEQEGVLVLTETEEPDGLSAIWVDTWHQHPQCMTLTGAWREDGSILVNGEYGDETYRAGWSIAVTCSERDGFTITMQNIWEGNAYDVVIASFAWTDQ